MILHTIVVRGSLILAEFSDSEEDYTQLLKKSISEFKNTSEKQKILKDDLYLYAIYDQEQDVKFICLSKDDDDSIFNALTQIIENAKHIQKDGKYSAELTQLIKQQFGKPKPKQQDDVENDPPIEIKKYIEERSSMDFQKKLCLFVTFMILSVFLFLNYIIQNE